MCSFTGINVWESVHFWRASSNALWSCNSSIVNYELLVLGDKFFGAYYFWRNPTIQLLQCQQGQNTCWQLLRKEAITKLSDHCDRWAMTSGTKELCSMAPSDPTIFRSTDRSISARFHGASVDRKVFIRWKKRSKMWLKTLTQNEKGVMAVKVI